MTIDDSLAWRLTPQGCEARHVRGTMYEVRFESLRALRGGCGAGAKPIFEAMSEFGYDAAAWFADPGEGFVL